MGAIRPSGYRGDDGVKGDKGECVGRNWCSSEGANLRGGKRNSYSLTINMVERTIKRHKDSPDEAHDISQTTSRNKAFN